MNSTVLTYTFTGYLSTALNFLITIITLRIFSLEQVGYSVLLISTLQLIDFLTTSSIWTFAVRYRSQKVERKFFGISLQLDMLSAGISTVIFLFAVNIVTTISELGYSVEHVMLMSLYYFFRPWNGLLTILYKRNKALEFTYATLVASALRLGFVLVIAKMPNGYEYLPWGIVAESIIYFIGIFFFASKTLAKEGEKITEYLGSAICWKRKHFICFARIMLMTGIAHNVRPLARQIVNQIVGYACGPAALAILSLMNSLNSVALRVFDAVRKVYISNYRMGAGSKIEIDTKKLLSKINASSLAVAVAGTVFHLTFGEQIYHFVFPSVTELLDYYVYYFPVMILGVGTTFLQAKTLNLGLRRLSVLIEIGCGAACLLACAILVSDKGLHAVALSYFIYYVALQTAYKFFQYGEIQ